MNNLVTLIGAVVGTLGFALMFKEFPKYISENFAEVKFTKPVNTNHFEGINMEDCIIFP